jgi:hypothetical protein
MSVVLVKLPVLNVPSPVFEPELPAPVTVPDVGAVLVTPEGNVTVHS